jgi:hypothetical protein
MIKEKYIIVRNDISRFNFLQSENGDWTNSFGSSKLFSLSDAKKLSLLFNCHVYIANDYGTNKQKVIY